MARLCERPGCSERGAIAYGFDAERLLVWLAAFDPDADRNRAGVLCMRHADSMVVPVGWTLDDARDPTSATVPGARATTRASVSRAARADSPATLGRRRRTNSRCPVAPGRTVAELSGAEPDDPDATVAMPWMPEFDESDDLGGLLAGRSPLLARAFRGFDAAALTAPMKTTITESFPARAPRSSSTSSTRSTATRRGCASCTG